MGHLTVRPPQGRAYTVDGCTFETAYFPTLKTSGLAPKPPVLTASPNPTSGTFTVELSEGIALSTEADLYGPFGNAPITSKRFAAGAKQVSFDASALPPGCYQVKLRGTLHSVRVIVR